MNLLAVVIALMLPQPGGPVTDHATIEDGAYRAYYAGDKFCVRYLQEKAAEALAQPIRGTFSPPLAPLVAQHERCGKYVKL